jgi:thiamine pyrophosphokinase
MTDSQLLIASSLDRKAPGFYRDLIQEASHVIAVDGGLWACRSAGTPPDLVVGDLDSADSDDVSWAKQAGVEFNLLAVEKDESDLRVAVEMALTLEAGRRTATGVLGARLDHELAGLGVLFASGAGWLIEETHTLAWVLHGPSTLEIEGPGAIFSVLAWGHSAIISIENATYPLTRHTIEPFSSLGVSNIVGRTTSSIVIESGDVLVVHPRLDSPPVLGYAMG